MSKLAWGIIGTGQIAGAFAEALASSETGELAAVGSRTRESADKFGEKYNVPRRYGSYDDLISDSGVQAVYISTPHPMHAEWAVRAAEAKKHILCEKPLTLDYAQAMAVVEAARRNDVFLMEAFMYRCHPQTAKLVELIRSRAIGDVRLIQATFSFRAGFKPESRLLNQALGGGGILDVGCYTVSMARLVAGAAVGNDFADPVDVKGAGHIGETGVDEWATAVLRFPGDILAQVSTGVGLNQENVVRIFGTEGSIFIPTPWIPSRSGGDTKITVQRYGQPAEDITIESPLGLYTIEADTVAAAVEQRQAPPPAMTWNDTLGNMRTLDRWRDSFGMVYEVELPTAGFKTIDGKPLSVRSANNMKYGRLEGLDKPVSKLVMGAMVGGATFKLPHGSVMFDDFFGAGGNCFDTAYIYGMSDQILGQWMKNRGIREQVVVLAKGAHTPFCDPESLTNQLFETLERMQTDYVDIYMMHRDNPEIPVGEFIDVLNEHHRAGRIRAFGGSNWSIERIEAANAYAKSKGLKGLSAVSNNFALARMIEPVWAGCLASSEPEFREWHVRTQMPVMSWSSTARGFFVTGDPKNLLDRSMVNCWYSEDNFRRLERAKELAAKKGVEPINIAMAYVLCQPFPTWTLFGPATPYETQVSLKSLDIQLTPEEMAWLNLEAP